ncbi:MAG: photosynthetic reaction center cytochrome c subunit family protein [Bryobacteraceae bacterium]
MRMLPGRVLMAAMTVVCLAPQAKSQTPSTTPMLSEQAFKNIQALKGIPVDDFMGTMGIMSMALGFDCSECHTGAGTDRVDWAADTPRKVTSRKMVAMVTNINRTNFTGRQLVTCWTCHRGRDRPVTTPAMEMVYGTPPLEEDDVIRATPGQTPPDQILEKYIQALGGAQKLAGLTSFVAEGKSVGFGGFGGDGVVQLYAKAPDQRSLVMVYKDAPGRGDTTRSYNGHIGWLRTPLNVLGEYELSGSELDGARLDAMLSFPGQIKQIFTDLKTGPPTTISDLPGPSSQTSVQSSVMVGQDRPVQVVQGTGPRGLLATMYFDKQSGLLLRLVRYGKSPIGRYPTEIDFADYRDVGGIKFPFRMTFAWLDGRDAIQLSEIRTNVPIDEAKFGRPPALQK